MRKVGLENLALTGPTKGKRNRGKPMVNVWQNREWDASKDKYCYELEKAVENHDRPCCEETRHIKEKNRSL